MLTQSAIDVDGVEAARKVYSVIRHINLAGGGGLEAHERLSLLTVAAGLRSFCLLTQIREEEFPLVSAALPVVGLTCGVCKASFNYDLDVDAPPEILEAFRTYEARDPLYGLGVAKSRVDFGETPLGTVLGYPKCCSEMDDTTKAFDRSATLRLLIDSKDGDYAGVIAELAREHATIPTPPTDRREAWDRRFDQTHNIFPFAIHTACDQCLEAGSESPSGLLSRRYEALVRAAAPDLYDAVLRQNDIFRQTSKFPT